VKNRIAFVIVGAALLAAVAITAAFQWQVFFPEGIGKKPRVIVIFKTLDWDNFFWRTLRDGVESAAKDYDVDFLIEGPEDEKYIDQQISIVEDAIRRQPAAIVMAATDFNRLVPVAEEIKKSGIHLVEIDSFINSRVADCKIGTDNIRAGRQAGEALVARIPEGSLVGIISYVKASSTAIDREAGVRGYLGTRMRILDTLYSNSEASQAYSLSARLIRTTPGLDAVVALNLPSTLGAAQALKESGKQGRIVLVSFDSSQDVLEYIEEGVILDTVVQKPFNMGYLGIRTARDLIDGKKIKQQIDTGSVVINKNNMYEPENQKLLFPVVK
jgi:ribose transport system substrate-binding protein